MIPTIYQRHAHRPDAERQRLRDLVTALHAAAELATEGLAELLAEAAATIDSCQAGLILATPHPLTGWGLVMGAGPEQTAQADEVHAQSLVAA